jgi:hypothetical protein
MDKRWMYGPGEEVGICPVDGVIIYAHETQDMVKYLGGQAGEIPVVSIRCVCDSPSAAPGFAAYRRF